MGLISLLQSYGATHLLTCDNEGFNVSEDLGNSVDPTKINSTNYNSTWDFTGAPVCEGFTNSLNAFGDLDNYTTKVYGGVIDSRNDLNSINGSGNDSTSSIDWNESNRTLLCWVRSKGLSGGFPTAVWGHGGGSNNQLFILGLGGKLGFQAADVGQPFLIATSTVDVEVERDYFMVGIWERHTLHSGDGNRILFYLNGKLQFIFELNGTDKFPNATGSSFIGNASTNYQGYGAGTIGYLQRPKEVQVVASLNNVSLTDTQQLDLYEQSVIPYITIEADTVENQQAALDLLTGSDFSQDPGSKNLAIRIVQATDATDYRLFLDNITFSTETRVHDISVQYMGSNTLTLENANGSNASITSSPSEVVRATETLIGGGKVVILEDTKRLNAVEDLSNEFHNKVVIEEPGTYTFTNLTFTDLENKSGGEVNIISDSSISSIVNSGTSTTKVLDSFLSFKGISNSWFVFKDPADSQGTFPNPAIDSGSSVDVFRYLYSGQTYYVKADGIIVGAVIPAGSGETEVNLSTAGLLTLINQNLSYIEKVIYCDTRLEFSDETGNLYNNLDDAIDKYNSGSYGHISLKTSLQVPATTTKSLDDVKIVGGSPSAHLVLRGNSMNSAELDNLLVQGIQGTTYLPSVFNKCKFVGNISGLVGAYEDIQITSLTGSSITVGFAGGSSLIGCNITSVAPVIFDLTGGVGVAMRNITGNFSISNIQKGSVVSIDSVAGNLELTDTCIGGTIRVFDTIRITDNSTGTLTDFEDVPTLEQIEASTILAKESTIKSLNNLSLTEVEASTILAKESTIKSLNNLSLTEVESSLGDLNNLSLTEVEASTILAKESTVNLIPKTDSIADLTPVLLAIASLNDPTVQDIRNAFDEAEFKEVIEQSDLHTWLDNYTNKEDWMDGETTVQTIITNLTTINEGIKKASLLIPYNGDLT